MRPHQPDEAALKRGFEVLRDCATKAENPQEAAVLEDLGRLLDASWRGCLREAGGR